MVIQGAARTINYQHFEVQVAVTADGRAPVFMTPDGTAHVFGPLTDEARRKLVADLQEVDVASPADAAAEAARARRNGPGRG